MRRITATRYVTPLREGGSLPAVIEGDDDGLYVLKLRGAGQGPKALVAEIIAGEIGRALGLKVPEIVLVDVDIALGRAEPDSEIRELLKRSVGLNVALDYLPGSIAFDPIAGPAPTAPLASEIVWFDALVTNVDRTAKNPNLLIWHKQLWLIDHGATLYFHHDWSDPRAKAQAPFPAIRQHVLLPRASELAAADPKLRALLPRERLEQIVREVPDELLAAGGSAPSPAEQRAGYVEFLALRTGASGAFVEEADRARAAIL